tara:strand:- start:5110 stop:5451 length:342 start_codon:yes stop_codon:yes gene_type:complete
MKTNHEQLILASVEKIEESEKTLEKISFTCCMPIRSKRMQDLFSELRNISKLLKNLSEEAMPICVSKIELCGSKIGKLYVSCCTEEREKLYQKLFKLLNEVHTNMYKLMGIAH